MSLPDFPDNFTRIVQSDVVEVDTVQAVSFSMQASASVAAGVLQEFNFTFTDPDYIYQPCYVIISPDAVTEHVDYIYFYTVPAMTGAGAGFKVYPLYENPALQYIDGDTIKVTVRNADASSRTIYVTLIGIRYPRPVGWIHPPYVQFSGLPLTGSIPLSVQFTDESDLTPTAWQWDFGDSESSTLQNPLHIYNSAGTFDVTLMASNAGGFDRYQRSGYIVATAYEYLLAYTEVDTGSYLTVHSDWVDWTLLPGNKTAYLYKDFGANYFNNIKIRWVMQVTKRAASLYFGAIALSNDVASVASSIGKRILVYYSNSSIYLSYTDNGVEQSIDSMAYNLATYYYLELERSSGSTTCTLKVYSDENYSVLLDTLTLTLAGFDLAFRYLYATDQWVSAVVSTSTGWNWEIWVMSH